MAQVLRVPGGFAGTERFTVRRKLGAGAMGSVYQALDRESGGDVAIKVLTHVEPLHIQRFKNEFRRLADVQHPNLVQLGELFSGYSVFKPGVGVPDLLYSPSCDIDRGRREAWRAVRRVGSLLAHDEDR